MTRWHVFYLGIACVMLLFLGGCASASAPPTSQQTTDRTAQAITPTVPPTKVAPHASDAATPSAGSYTPMLQCKGEGSPTVVLEHGMDENQFTWLFVKLDVAEFTRVCSYTRAQKGQVPQPYTIEQSVVILHTMLGNAEIDGPYVLVGHSFGGLNVRLYAHHYPDEVVGIVLVDAAHEDVWERWLAVLPPESQWWNDVQAFLEDPNLNSEGLDIEVSTAQVRASGSLDDIPLVVLTRGRPDPPPDLPQDTAVQVEEVWQDLQQDLPNLSTNSAHIIAEESGHMIHKDQPYMVVDAIRHLVDAAREQ